MPRLLQDAVAGAVGGVVGTALMQQGMARMGEVSERLPEALRPAPLREDPAEHMTLRAETRLGRELSPRVRGGVVRGLHWAYGTFWPLLTALALRRRQFRRLGPAVAIGAGLGAGVWAVGYLGWMPALRIMEPSARREVKRQTVPLLSHVLYGMVSMLPLYGASRMFGTSRRQRWLRRIGWAR